MVGVSGIEVRKVMETKASRGWLQKKPSPKMRLGS